MMTQAAPAPDMSGVDPGLQPTLFALLYLFPALALAVLLVRFWRRWTDHLLGGDDALIAIAWVFSLGNSIIVHLYCKENYTGYRDEDVPVHGINVLRTAKLRYALGVEYNPCICFVKASFLWTLYKLRSEKPAIRRSIIGLQILNAVYMVATTVISAIPCLPVSKAWNYEQPGGCYDPVLYVSGNVSVVIITDFLVLLIPTWIIWDLQMPMKRKLIAITFLSLGILVIAIGIARLVWILDAFKGKTSSYSVEAAYSAIESSIAIIGTSGQAVKHILSQCIPSLRPSFEHSSSSKSSSNAYREHSQFNTRRGRAQYNTDNGYGDLDSISARNEALEMKNDWQWQPPERDDDAKSDEQRITLDPKQAIMKSMEWTVHARDDSHSGRAVAGEASVASGRPPASPAHMV